jgi:TPR repeat protein
MAMAFDNGERVTANPQIAMAWLKRSAEAGYAVAQYELARRHVLMDDPKYTPQDGLKWYEKAANQGHLRAQYSLAVCLASAKGGSRDLSGAYFWMRRAADGGFPKAEHRIRILEKQLDPDSLRDARRRLSNKRSAAVID